MKEKNTATSTQATINTIDDLNALIERVSKAQKILATYSQEQVDKIFEAMAIAANASSASRLNPAFPFSMNDLLYRKVSLHRSSWASW